MVKKVIITLAAFAVIAVCAFSAVGMTDSSVSLPRQLTAETTCPVAGCTLDGACHDYSNVPAPDGVREMSCPEATCSSTDCHAWDSLVGRYHQASDASLNLWIMLPAAIVAAFIVVARKAGRNGKD